MDYQRDCAGCRTSQGLRHSAGGLLKLPGDWTANQYGGPEGWLGWLALQPRYHRMALSELTPVEAAALGLNIQALDLALSQYWRLHFPKDGLSRVYVVYFFESAYQTPQEREPFHLHIHLIPRFQSLNVPGALQRKDSGTTWADGWLVPSLMKGGAIRKAYSRKAPKWEHRATGLMDYLRHELASRP